MSEVCTAFNECAFSEAEDCGFESTSTLLSSNRKQLSKSLVLPSRRKSVSANSNSSSFTSGTTEGTYKDDSLQEIERRDLWVRTKKLTL